MQCVSHLQVVCRCGRGLHRSCWQRCGVVAGVVLPRRVCSNGAIQGLNLHNAAHSCGRLIAMAPWLPTGCSAARCTCSTLQGPSERVLGHRLQGSITDAVSYMAAGNGRTTAGSMVSATEPQAVQRMVLGISGPSACS